MQHIARTATAAPHPYFMARATKLLPDGANPVPLATWAQEARERDERTIGVLVADDGRIIAHTRYPGSGPYRVHFDEARAMGTMHTAVDMVFGAARRYAGMNVQHITASQASKGPGLPKRWAEADIPRLTERLLDKHEKVTAAEAALCDARAAERDAAKALHQAGVSKYKIAQMLGISQPTAARLVQ